MARGRHASKAAGRRAQALADQIAHLCSEIEMENASLQEAITLAAVVENDTMALAEATAALTRETTPSADRLRAEVDFMISVIKRVREADEKVTHHWEALCDRALERLGRGVEAVEKFGSVLEGKDIFLMPNSVSSQAQRRLTRAQMARLEKIRGERKRTPITAGDEDGEPDESPEWTRDLLRRPESAGPDDEWWLDQDYVNEARQAPNTTLTIDAIHMWNPAPTLNADTTLEGDIADRLGASFGDTPNSINGRGSTLPPPTPSLSATSREHVAAMSPEGFLDHWRGQYAATNAITSLFAPFDLPTRAAPPHYSSTWAAVLKHHYSRSALGSWSRAYDDGNPLSWGRITTALTAGAIYWLPSGHTFAFADSEPLDDAARRELLLPFPQVFLAFAEPLALAPLREPTLEEAGALAAADRSTTLTINKSESLRIWHLTNKFSRALRLTNALAARGGQVEGVVLLADALGRISDEFAWCVTIPAGARANLGRFVIPSRLSKTAYRDVIENLIAVTSWANWHEPNIGTAIPPNLTPKEAIRFANQADFKHSIDRAGSGGVRVLNVEATLKATRSDRGERTGRHLAPHVRRGHWRRQHFGKGSQQVKRVRIAPVIVNAHRGEDIAPTVYVLGRPKP